MQMSLAFLPTALITAIMNFWEDDYINNSQVSLQISVIGFAIVGIGLFLFLKRRSEKKEEYENSLNE